MPKKRKFKIKDIITRDINGLVTNYGPLMIGYVNGIPCLAHREVLLLLGIKLGNHKPPQTFYNVLQLRIPVAGCYLTVYAVNGHQVDALGKQLSKRDYDVRAYSGHPHEMEPKKIFKHGEMIVDEHPIEQPKLGDPFAYHGRSFAEAPSKGTQYRTSRWGRFKLLVGRLFGKAA